MPGLRLVLCISALVALGSCGLADIPRQNQAIEAENMRVYAIYNSYMQSLNEQRDQSGLNPERIRSYEEWQRSPGTP